MILFNGIEENIKAYNELTLKVCDRHFGIGAYGIMICENSDVADIKEININNLGRKIEIYPLFPRKTNVDFVQIIDYNNTDIYTWERVSVNIEWGNLVVELNDNYKISMSGNAFHIASGENY